VDGAGLEACTAERAEAEGVGAGKLIHPLRVALTGPPPHPGIFEVAACSDGSGCWIGWIGRLHRAAPRTGRPGLIA
jgi:hypothetical protein